MTAEQYRAAIAALDLNQVAAAKFLGISPRSSRQYAADGAPYFIGMLLWLMVKHKIEPASATALVAKKVRK